MLHPDQLRLLQVVARTGSYSAAARELGFSQPAISYQMRRLEKQVGSRLAVRCGRTMRMTLAGKALLSRAEHILLTIRAAEVEIASLAGHPVGPVRLAAFPSSCASLVPQAMATMRREAPDVVVELTQAEPPDAVRLVHSGAVDAALTYDFSTAASPEERHDVPGDVQLTSHPIVAEEVHLVLPANHPRAARRMIDLPELRDETWIVAQGRLYQELEEATGRCGIVPKVMVVDDDYVMMQALVARGFGIAFLPTLALSVHRDPRVVPRTLRGWPRRHLHVVHWPEMGELAIVRLLVKHLQGAAGTP